MEIQPKKRLRGILTVPGDKSISHRGIFFGALADGVTRLEKFLFCADSRSTIGCFSELGVPVDIQEDTVLVHGRGLHGLRAPKNVLDVGNSGTTTRLLTGLLAGQPFTSVLDGDHSLRTRPMARVMNPLSQMGANIEAKDDNHCPLTIHGRNLHGISYTLPVASAQLKSALIFAGMFADSETVIRETHPSRNHTEQMLLHFGGKFRCENNVITISPQERFYAQELAVPGDISSAAFFLVAGCIVPDSELLIKGVGINPTRTGVLDVLAQMGADITLQNQTTAAEPSADLLVRSSSLRGCEISGALIPRLIDELPIIAVAAAFAEGTTVIKDAEELKHKESNRIHAVVTELSKAGVDITETDDGMIIRGGAVCGADFEAYDDHRIAMAMAVCALGAHGVSTISGEKCVGISYPSFFEDLRRISEEA
ncbi:MAG: 3-phosphoshikimate 1-carboxyvinyltransferase [Ruminococcaceae bacterium]|nr:3-phosphoshikimate 1-carboxyvinyltransferase [Oscillospiraceae bacterium]